MRQPALQIAARQTAAHIARAGLVVGRFLVLSLALVCYGSMPGTPTAQSEYEAQLQEEFHSGHSAQCDLRNRLRGSSQRRAGATLVASFGQLACRPHHAAADDAIAPKLSLGLVLPLRC